MLLRGMNEKRMVCKKVHTSLSGLRFSAPLPKYEPRGHISLQIRVLLISYPEKTHLILLQQFDLRL